MSGEQETLNQQASNQTAGSNEPVYVVDDLIAQDIDAYLKVHQHKTMLRFITCGSVDDGKSTLIGRLLHDSGQLFEDQLEALKADIISGKIVVPTAP